MVFTLFILTSYSCRGPDQVENPEQELLKVDRAFSDLSRSRGMNHAFAAYCHDQGVLLRPESYPVEGKEKIVALLQKNNDSAFQLTWEPVFASVAESGELGYTYGTYRQMIRGTEEVHEGTYLSIWRKEKDGWKFVLDTGNEGLGE